VSIPLTEGRRPVTPGGGAGFGARGRRLVTFAPGRLGHHACRHYDRHARCSLQPEPAPRETPDDYGARSAKPGPTLSLWMRESRGQEPQWNAGRRVRPQHFWVATSEGVAHAAPAGAVPHPHGADRQALSLPRVCRRSASFLFFLFSFFSFFSLSFLSFLFLFSFFSFFRSFVPRPTLMDPAPTAGSI
jgi:hypothetical protein